MSRCLQGQRDLVGFWIDREWVKEHYPLFCRALVVVLRAYKDFAKQLAFLMPRERKEIWNEGRRIMNFTAYRVLDPDAAVVELAQQKRSGREVEKFDTRSPSTAHLSRNERQIIPLPSRLPQPADGGLHGE